MPDRPDFRETVNVECPKCGALAGQPCKGKGPVSFHQARHDLWYERYGQEKP